jgi:hypothetical protein
MLRHWIQSTAVISRHGSYAGTATQQQRRPARATSRRSTSRSVRKRSSVFVLDIESSKYAAVVDSGGVELLVGCRLETPDAFVTLAVALARCDGCRPRERVLPCDALPGTSSRRGAWRGHSSGRSSVPGCGRSPLRFHPRNPLRRRSPRASRRRARVLAPKASAPRSVPWSMRRQHLAAGDAHHQPLDAGDADPVGIYLLQASTGRPA